MFEAESSVHFGLPETKALLQLQEVALSKATLQGIVLHLAASQIIVCSAVLRGHHGAFSRNDLLQNTVDRHSNLPIVVRW